MPIYNKKPMSLRKGIGFCQQSVVIDEFLSLFLLTRGSQTPIIPIKLLGIVSGGTDYEAML